jgi:hypothetical protein
LLREKDDMPTARAENLYFYKQDPVIEAGGARSWYGRSQNLLVAYSKVDAGDALTIENSENEYFIVLIEGSIEVTTDNGSGLASSPAQIIVPPGASRIDATTAGTLVRIFAPPPRELADRVVNNASYDEPHPNVGPLDLWPMPEGGYKLRIYQFDKMPADAKKIFRSRNIMINWAGEYTGPRDVTRLSPHKHDDFEQVSLCIEGKFVHHVRYPWESDSTTWMEDDHIEIDTPSITIMPPPALHTSVRVGERNALVDIFGPPRMDFSLGGMVNAENAADYPIPEGGGDTMRSGENCQIEGVWRSACDDAREVTVRKGDLFPSCPSHGTVEYRLIRPA